jgi:hypothetical protein
MTETVELNDDDDEPLSPDQQKLAALLEQIDGLCVELEDARAPRDNVSAGVELVIAGEDSNEVASRLRAASHAKELRESILKVAIESLARDAVALDAKVKGRRTPTFGNQFRNWMMAPGTVNQFLGDVFARELALEVARRSEAEQNARYDRAMAKYKKLRGEYEHTVGSGGVAGWDPLTHGMTPEEMADLNPPGNIKGGYTVIGRKSGSEVPA